MASALQGAIEFFREFGLFDVVLPFILVFTLIFAILEKTMILGVEKEGVPKKNLDAMVAFVVALLVVAASNIVGAINAALPQVVLLVVISISFLLLLGVFWKTGESDFMKDHRLLYWPFVGFFLLAIIWIFFGVFEKTPGYSYRTYFLDYVMYNWSGSVFTSLIFLVVVIAVIAYVVKGPSGGESEE